MVSGPAIGYVYGIKDPDTEQYVFVGNGPRPWESIKRHLRDSSNPRLKQWIKDLFNKYPKGLEVLDTVVCEQYHYYQDTGELIPLPAIKDGVTRLEWTIFGEEENSRPDEEIVEPRGHILNQGTLKSRTIRRLKNEGHPLVNGVPGRKKREPVE